MAVMYLLLSGPPITQTVQQNATALVPAPKNFKVSNELHVLALQ